MMIIWLLNGVYLVPIMEICHRRILKVKANRKFSERVGCNSKLYSNAEYDKLKRGKIVDLNQESAKKLISYGLAEKVSSPKPKKVKENK